MRKITLAIIAVMVFTSFAFAAVSSPCSGYKKPAKEPAPPREYVETGNKRDVLDNRVPTKTVRKGNISDDMAQATKDRETLISGQQ